MNAVYFRVIEHELQNFDAGLRWLKEIRETLAEENMGIDYTRDVVQTSNISDRTANTGILLASSTAVQFTERNIKAIDTALNKLTATHRHLFNLHYRMCKDPITVCAEIPCSISTFYKLRRELVKEVGKHLGYWL